LPFRLRGLPAVAFAFAVPLVVLLASVRTSVGFWDTGDLQTVSWIAGIPYPTGFPGYVMVGWLWTHALPFASVAARLNALSAASIAAAAATVAGAALWFGVRPLIAVLAACTFAFAHTVWYRATYADVHPLGFAVAFAAIALALRWALRRDARALAFAVPLGGAALAIDNTTVLMLAGGVVVALTRRLPAGLTARAIGIAALIVVVAYAYLPLRSAYVTAQRLDPTLALGIAPGRPFWDDHHPATREGFRSLVAGSEWGPGQTLLALFTPDTIRAAGEHFGAFLIDDETQVLLLAALIGLGFLAAQWPGIVLGLVVAALVPALFGASYQAEADPSRYVFALYAVLALGVAVAAERTVRAFGRERPATALGLVAALLALVVVRDFVLAGDLFARRADDSAIRLGERVATSTRDGAVVVAPWDWATPLAYKAYVEHGLGRRIVVCALSLDHLADYRRWLRTRQVTILSDGPPELPGYRTRRLSGSGAPQVYEVLAP
jgi:hypothetical protein